MTAHPQRRGIHLEYRFESSPAGQRGAAITNPLIDLLRTLRDHRLDPAAARRSAARTATPGAR